MKKKIILSLALIASAGLLYKLSIFAVTTPKTWTQKTNEEKLEDIKTDLIEFRNILPGEILKRDGLIEELNGPIVANFSAENKKELDKRIRNIQKNISQRNLT